MAKGKGQSFLTGATILMAGAILVKVIGACFKIPLTRILGGTGMGYFMTAYSFFNPIYALSVAGFPIAVSKMVSECIAGGKPEERKAILRDALVTFSLVGFALSLAIYFGASGFVKVVGNPAAFLCVVAIAPAIFFTCISSVFRGYNEGMRNMVPTASSQVVEALAKLLFGILFAFLCVRYGYGQYRKYGVAFGMLVHSEAEFQAAVAPYASAAAVLGVSLSTAIGAFFLSARQAFKARRVLFTKAQKPHKKREKSHNYSVRLLKLAIPVCLGALVVNLTSFIDLMSVMNRLSSAIGLGYDEVVAAHPGAGLSLIARQELPNFLYGSYTGLAITVFNLIPAITASLGVSALPMVTSLCAARKHGELMRTVESVIRITTLIAVPAGLGLFVMSGPVLTLLFGNNPSEVAVAAPLLSILGLAVIFVAVCAPVNSMLQAIGRIYVPVKLMLIGGALKLLTNYVLVGIPGINIKGAPYGTLVCYAFMMVAGLAVLFRETGANLNLFSLFLKPLIASLLCAAAAYSSYGFLIRRFQSSLVVLAAVAIGGFVYLAATVLLRTIRKDDLMMLKSDPKFVNTLAKKNLLG